MPQLDLIDRKIVAILMADATMPVARIAEKVGLSQTPCWKRIQRLESSGVLTGRVAVGDAARLGCGLIAFVAITAPEHSAEWRESFLDLVDSLPQVMEVHRMAGEIDYLLRVAVSDMAAYDALYRQITDRLAVRSIQSHFAMEKVKFSTVYPVDTVNW